MISAVVIASLALTGKIEMDRNMAYGEELRRFIFNLSGRLTNPFIDLLLIALIVIFIKIMIKEARRGEKKES